MHSKDKIGSLSMKSSKRKKPELFRNVFFHFFLNERNRTKEMEFYLLYLKYIQIDNCSRFKIRFWCSTFQFWFSVRHLIRNDKTMKSKFYWNDQVPSRQCDENSLTLSHFDDSKVNTFNDPFVAIDRLSILCLIPWMLVRCLSMDDCVRYTFT